MKKATLFTFETTPQGHLSEGNLKNVLGYLLAQATVTADSVFASQVGDPLGLRKVEYTLLCLIAHNPGVKPAQLGRALHFTAPNTTVWIDKLVNKNLVARVQQAQDKRAQHLTLTKQGQDVYARATEAIAAGENRCFERLTEGERLLLAELLHKVAQANTPK